MEINILTEITLGNLISFLGFIATAIGLFVAVKQMKRNFKIQKSNLILKITDELFEDSAQRQFFYKIDYERFKFDLDNLDSFKESDDERRLDSLLYKYDAISKVIRMKLIDIEDIEFLMFEIIQVLENKEVQKYISWLENEFENHGVITNNKRLRPHDDVRWLIEELEKR